MTDASSQRWQRLQAIFRDALEHAGEERDQYLQEACGDDAELREEVRRLLDAHNDASPTHAADGRNLSSPPGIAGEYSSGDSIEAFKIIEKIGEGGFGIVYLAQQFEPLKRRVAIKVIKPGMDTRAVIARFEAERQALAMMDHPGIARVYEAGATPEGRPYFVMEFVKGEKLTTYCDRHTLDTRGRLVLFTKVCDAIQHAHQKGIIHRDLKPGNILITIDQRDEPQPKVIDFGIAKATEQPLTEKTLFTEHGQLIGTPEYMSPEQAELSISDIDTRSDVYSLGVVLYELLAGRLPFDPKSLREAGFAEIQRIIREDDPPKPSTRLSTLEKGEGARIAAVRQTGLAELTGTLRRELEWIPLKALRKDRTDRYASAHDFGEDVRRYLVGEPLEAGPESAAYRARKFVRRNRGPVIAAVLMITLLVAGIVSTSIFAVRASEQARLAEARAEEAQLQADRATAVTDFVTSMLSSVNPGVAGPMDKSLMKLVLANAATTVGEEFKEKPHVELEIRMALANAYSSIGLIEEAAPHTEKSVAIARRIHDDDDLLAIKLTMNLGALRHQQGRFEDAERHYRASIDDLVRLRGDDDPASLRATVNLTGLLLNQGRLDEAETELERLLPMARRALGEKDRVTAFAASTLAQIYVTQNRMDDAEALFLASLASARGSLGEGDRQTQHAISNLGAFYLDKGDHEKAVQYMREALEVRQRELGEHVDTMLSVYNLGFVLAKVGKDEEALPLLEASVEAYRIHHGESADETSEAISELIACLERLGRDDEAEQYRARSDGAVTTPGNDGG